MAGLAIIVFGGPSAPQWCISSAPEIVSSSQTRSQGGWLAPALLSLIWSWHPQQDCREDSGGKPPFLTAGIPDHILRLSSYTYERSKLTWLEFWVWFSPTSRTRVVMVSTQPKRVKTNASARRAIKIANSVRGPLAGTAAKSSA